MRTNPDTHIHNTCSIAGWAGATLNPAWFVTEQTTSSPASHPAMVDDNARLVALQLGNTYGLVFLVASAVLYTTSEIRVVRNYLVACWLADISHVYVCYHVLGWDSFVDVAGWNSLTWGNVGVTVGALPPPPPSLFPPPGVFFPLICKLKWPG